MHLRFNTIQEDNHKPTFAGVHIGQSWADMSMWETFLNRNDIGTIYELGTHRGGMTMFLSAQSFIRGSRRNIVSYDSVDWGAARLIFPTHVSVVLADLLTEPYQPLIENLQNDQTPYLLYVDNGNKPLEYAYYAPYVRKDCFIAVHDVDTEFKSEQFKSDPTVVEIMHDERIGRGSLTAFLRKL